jgi:hypothetical protein
MEILAWSMKFVNGFGRLDHLFGNKPQNLFLEKCYFEMHYYQVHLKVTQEGSAWKIISADGF